MKDSQSCRHSIVEPPQPLLMESPSPGLDQPLQEPARVPRAQLSPQLLLLPQECLSLAPKGKGMVLDPLESTQNPSPLTCTSWGLAGWAQGHKPQGPLVGWSQTPGSSRATTTRGRPRTFCEGDGEGSEQALQLETAQQQPAHHGEMLESTLPNSGSSKHLCNKPRRWHTLSLQTGWSSQLPETEGKNTPNSRGRTCLVKHGPAEAQGSILVPAGFITFLFFH